MRALLISTYEMGRQPFGIASPAAWLRAAGVEVRIADVSRQTLTADEIRGADLVGIHLPMHTATRLAVPVIRKVRAENPAARLCAYGLYAPLNADWLRALGVDDVLDGEFEEDLMRIASAVRTGEGRTPHAERRAANPEPPVPARLHFIVPDRAGLPPLARYASLQLPDGIRRTVGYTEATRGCRHLCRHCPIVPIYNGQFRVVPADVVLADIAAQVSAGAQHITFGDPDFFNGPTHAMRIVEALHTAYPGLTYDVTIKVEHLLRHRRLLPRLRETACLFVTSAVEALDDRVLAALRKGHTRHDFLEAVDLFRREGLTLVPTFVAFHPWTTLASYCDLVDTIEAHDLVEHVAPIQLAIRLLIPQGSRMLELEEVRRLTGAFDPATLTHRWQHPDAAVDALQQEIGDLVGTRIASGRRALFDAISEIAHDRAGIARPRNRPVRDRATVPYLNEPWYC